MNSADFQNIIDYKFNNIHLLEEALTHSSCASDGDKKNLANNEKLEFLGDAFLDAIISEYLFRYQKAAGEGIFSRTRALIVCEKSLAEIGKTLGVGPYIKMGRGEEMNGGRNRASILADAVEALIGAIYLDRGYQAAQGFVLAYFEEAIQDAIENEGKRDYKTLLQEKLQASGILKIDYLLDKEEGPAHNKTFYIKLTVNGNLLGEGCGKNKKEAEQAAAQDALERGGQIVF